MDPTILAALIGSAATIVAPVVTYLVTRASQDRNLASIHEQSRNAIVGEWSGEAKREQLDEDGPNEYQVSWKFMIRGKRVEGTSDMRAEVDGKVELRRFRIQGGFVYGKFLLLNYYPEDETTIHFGADLLELAADGKSLRGRFVGYSVRSEKIISGIVTMSKVS